MIRIFTAADIVDLFECVDIFSSLTKDRFVSEEVYEAYLKLQATSIAYSEAFEALRTIARSESEIPV